VSSGAGQGGTTQADTAQTPAHAAVAISEPYLEPAAPHGTSEPQMSTPRMSEAEQLDLAIAMSLDDALPTDEMASDETASVDESAPRVGCAIAEEQAVLAQAQMAQSDLTIALLLSEEDAAREAADASAAPPPTPAAEREKACAICMDKLDDPVPAGQCLHLFCRSCILGWVPANGEQVCPTCREATFSRAELRAMGSFRMHSSRSAR